MDGRKSAVGGRVVGSGEAEGTKERRGKGHGPPATACKLSARQLSASSHSSRELPLTMRMLASVSLTQGPAPWNTRPSCLASRMHSPPSVVHAPCRAGAGPGWAGAAALGCQRSLQSRTRAAQPPLAAPGLARMEGGRPSLRLFVVPAVASVPTAPASRLARQAVQAKLTVMVVGTSRSGSRLVPLMKRPVSTMCPCSTMLLCRPRMAAASWASSATASEGGAGGEGGGLGAGGLGAGWGGVGGAGGGDGGGGLATRTRGQGQGGRLGSAEGQAQQAVAAAAAAAGRAQGQAAAALCAHAGLGKGGGVGGEGGWE